VEQRVIEWLKAHGRTLAVAESCTGGRIADRLTNVAGSSGVFRAGLVTYQDQGKQKFLGVQAGTLARDGAVSEATAREMAAGARHVCAVDYALATTGFAGPDGGAPGLPVGTVFVGLASADAVRVKRLFHPMERVAFKEFVAGEALALLLDFFT
jgi:PncC family amidohydrolase